MDWKLEVVVIPVTDIDRAKSFYTAKLGFRLDADTTPTETMRVVHMTPPGSGCSVVIGPKVVPAGTDLGGASASLQLVVPDIEAARSELADRGVEVESQLANVEALGPVDVGDRDHHNFQLPVHDGRPFGCRALLAPSAVGRSRDAGLDIPANLAVPGRRPPWLRGHARRAAARRPSASR